MLHSDLSFSEVTPYTHILENLNDLIATPPLLLEYSRTPPIPSLSLVQLPVLANSVELTRFAFSDGQYVNL